jgi:hypothetical protein
MSIAQSPLYPEILDRLKSGEKLLDVGCAVGQELRQLVGLSPFFCYQHENQSWYADGLIRPMTAYQQRTSTPQISAKTSST